MVRLGERFVALLGYGFTCTADIPVQTTQEYLEALVQHLREAFVFNGLEPREVRFCRKDDSLLQLEMKFWRHDMGVGDSESDYENLARQITVIIRVVLALNLGSFGDSRL